MIGIRALRAELATYLRRAGAGQRIVVTVDGRAVAQLGPVEPEAGHTVLDDLISAGAVIAPRRSGLAPTTTPVRVWSGVRIDRALKELRG
jgi:prevent-host-death family protein